MTAGRITDEAEAWLFLAELIEGGRTMPDFGPFEACFGLCACLIRMEECGLLDFDTSNEMELRLTEVSKRPGHYIYPAREWRPRVALCRRFAAQVLKERGTT